MRGSVPTMVLSALLMAASVWLLLPPMPRERLSLVAGDPGSGRARGPRPDVDMRIGAAVVLGVGLAGVTGGLVGLAVGLVGGFTCSALLHRIEPAQVRREREQLRKDLPLAVDLLAACLAVGRPPAEAVSCVADAVGGPVQVRLAHVSRQLTLGGDPVSVWRHLGPTDALAPLGRTMVRAIETGAPVADGLSRLVDDLRLANRWATNERARSVGVRAAAPLGLCFLPAFVCIGIIPTIAAALLRLAP